MKKDNLINFRVSDQEMARYKRLSERRKMPLSELIRQCLNEMADRLRVPKGVRKSD